MASLYNLNTSNASDAGIPGEALQPCDPGDLACIAAFGTPAGLPLTCSPSDAACNAAVSATASSLATVAAVAPLSLSSTFTLGSFSFPVWGLGVAAIAAVMFLGKR